MSRTIKDPLKTIDFKGFQGFFNVQGQPRLSSKGNLAYPLPISPKNKTEAKYTGKLSLWFKPYWHLIPLNPSIFKAFSLHPSNLKWPHRKDSSSLQGHLNLLYSLFGAAPDCPHRIIGCASGYGEMTLYGYYNVLCPYWQGPQKLLSSLYSSLYTSRYSSLSPSILLYRVCILRPVRNAVFQSITLSLSLHLV